MQNESLPEALAKSENSRKWAPYQPLNQNSNALAGILGSILETACEYEHELELSTLLNYIDLYRVYVCLINAPDIDVALHHSAYMAPAANGAMRFGGGSNFQDPADRVYSLRSADLQNFECFVRNQRLLSLIALIASVQYGEEIAEPIALNATNH